MPEIPPTDGPAYRLLLRRLHRIYNETLDATPDGRWERYGNLGYESVDGVADERRLVIGRFQPRRTSAQLVAELVGDTPVDQRAVLDVGCGRGGPAELLKRNGARVVGVDLSDSSVAAARRLGSADIGLAAADAEALPFRADRFDLVLSLESSFHYPSIEVFFGEVWRVLRPGGRLLWGDIIPEHAQQPLLGLLADLGYQVERQRDVSANVIASLAARGDAELTGPLQEYARTAEYHDGLRTGSYRYLLLRLVPGDELHPASRAATSALVTARWRVLEQKGIPVDQVLD